MKNLSLYSKLLIVCIYLFLMHMMMYNEAIFTSNIGSESSQEQSKEEDIKQASPNCSQQGQDLLDFLSHVPEQKVYSQNGEDGVILYLLERFGDDTQKYYVEFGTQRVTLDVGEINTRLLREQHGYTGLLMDGSHENPEVNQHKHFIAHDNIVSLFQLYQVPLEFNLLSIDVDFDDWWIWQALLKANYRARVVVVEYNSKFGETENKVINVKDPRRWTETDYTGASFSAFKSLARAFGYTLVYAEDMGVNLFFVRNDLLLESPCEITDAIRDNALWKPPRYGPGGKGHVPEKDTTRKWIWNPDPMRVPDESYPEPVNVAPVQPLQFKSSTVNTGTTQYAFKTKVKTTQV